MLIFSSNLPLSVVGVDRAPIAAAVNMESSAVLPPTAPVSALIPADTRHSAGNPGPETPGVSHLIARS
jgi:hypothetical protein